MYIPIVILQLPLFQFSLRGVLWLLSYLAKHEPVCPKANGLGLLQPFVLAHFMSWRSRSFYVLRNHSHFKCADHSFLIGKLHWYKQTKGSRFKSGRVFYVWVSHGPSHMSPLKNHIPTIISA